MTSRKLTALGHRYMRALGMVEWIPRAVFRVRKLDELYGESSWHAEERQCWIAVAPADPAVMEETLVHEILHVLIEGHMPMMREYDPGYELALNRLAKTLCKIQSATRRITRKGKSKSSTSLKIRRSGITRAT